MSKSYANVVSFAENVSYLSTSMNLYERSEFISANKMFEAKAKLFTKNNAKPKHKSSIQSGDMKKLNTLWKGRTRTAFGKMRRSKLSLFGFLCVFILLAAAEIVNKKEFFFALV